MKPTAMERWRFQKDLALGSSCFYALECWQTTSPYSGVFPCSHRPPPPHHPRFQNGASCLSVSSSDWPQRWAGSRRGAGRPELARAPLVVAADGGHGAGGAVAAVADLLSRELSAAATAQLAGSTE